VIVRVEVSHLVSLFREGGVQGRTSEVQYTASEVKSQAGLDSESVTFYDEETGIISPGS
jgi:hypothetical protein